MYTLLQIKPKYHKNCISWKVLRDFTFPDKHIYHILREVLFAILIKSKYCKINDNKVTEIDLNNEIDSKYRNQFEKKNIDLKYRNRFEIDKIDSK